MTMSPVRTIRVDKAYSVGKLTPTELLEMAAAVPAGSGDPVDLALNAELENPEVERSALAVRDFSHATPERKYSLARAELVDDFGRHKQVSIMRGDMDSVLAESYLSKDLTNRLLRNAEMMHTTGRRCMGVALADVSADGTVGRHEMQGFIALSPQAGPSDPKSLSHESMGDWVRIELWSRALRFQHWANVFLIVMMSLTGYYIMDPFFGGTPGAGDTGFLMGWIRFAHFISAFLWLSLGIWRLSLWLFSSQKQLRWRALWPLDSMRDVKGLWETTQYYLFLKKEGPLYLAHNPLQQFAYTGIYLLCLLQMITGLALYGLYHQTNWFWELISMPNHWIGIPYMRLIHAAIMFIIWAFVILHVYLAVRADTQERHGGISSMFNGGVWIRRGHRPVDAQRIGKYGLPDDI